MSLPLTQPFPPMEALSVDEIPIGQQWQYEPKWDGFRCLVFRDGKSVHLQSKSGQPLGRYFPELVAAAKRLAAAEFVLDGEIVIPVDERLSFDELLLRIHPASSRVQKLAAAHPAVFVAFDLLVEPGGEALFRKPLEQRRQRLERFAREQFDGMDEFRVSPATTNLAKARAWFESAGSDLDGIVAKRLRMEYQSGERTGMLKVKPIRTADCVVGGFRYLSKKKVVGSLLLGLYDDQGLLHHVGFCSGLKAEQRKELLPKLSRLVRPPGFTGRAPGGPSRWNAGKPTAWEPLRPELVVEVGFDHFTGGRFRHGTRLIRWRPDKAPQQCRIAQVSGAGKTAFQLL